MTKLRRNAAGGVPRRARRREMTKAVAYCRTASREQGRFASGPIVEQAKAIEAYAERKKLTIVATFHDEGSSGDLNRRGLQNMIAFVRANPEVSALLTTTCDRLSRTFNDYVTIVRLLGIEIHLVNEGGVAGEESLQQLTLLNSLRQLIQDHYTQTISTAVRKSLRAQAENGMWPSGAPIGYRRDPCTRMLEPDSESAKLVREAFVMTASGSNSFVEIRNKLFDQGLRSRREGGRLTISQVHGILSNPFYYGSFRWNGKMYKGVHTQIISKKLFDRVQKVLARMTTNSTRPSKGGTR